MEKILLVAGGEVDSNQLQSEIKKIKAFDVEKLAIVGVDGGAHKLLEANCVPPMLFGDFDSLEEKELQQMISLGTEVYRYPEHKDETDLELALDWAADSGCQTARVLGGLGGRFDHSLGNLGLLVKMWHRGLKVYLLDVEHTIFVFDGTCEFGEYLPGTGVSLIPIEGKARVTTEGFEYPLCDEELFFASTRGIHNKIQTIDAKVHSEGLLLAVCFRDR